MPYQDDTHCFECGAHISQSHQPSCRTGKLHEQHLDFIRGLNLPPATPQPAAPGDGPFPEFAKSVLSPTEVERAVAWGKRTLHRLATDGDVLFALTQQRNEAEAERDQLRAELAAARAANESAEMHYAASQDIVREMTEMLQDMWHRAGGAAFLLADGSLHPGTDAQMAEVFEFLWPDGKKP